MTVARMGSVKAAARELGVSEPAISGAVGVLRRELGDDLYFRSGGALVLTPGGRRLASAAGEILSLADDTKRAVRESGGLHTTLRVAVTQSVAELAAEPLLDAFLRRASRDRDRDADRARQPVRGTARRRPRRRGRSVRGRTATSPRSWSPSRSCATRSSWSRPRATRWPARTVSRPRRSSARRGCLGRRARTRRPKAGAFLARQAIAPQRSRTFPNIAAALAQVAAGRGVSLAVAHTVRDELERGALVVLDVRGTPIPGLWHVSVPGPERRTAPADALRQVRDAAGGDAGDAVALRRGSRRALPAGDPDPAGALSAGARTPRLLCTSSRRETSRRAPCPAPSAPGTRCRRCDPRSRSSAAAGHHACAAARSSSSQPGYRHVTGSALASDSMSISSCSNVGGAPTLSYNVATTISAYHLARCRSTLRPPT